MMTTTETSTTTTSISSTTSSSLSETTTEMGDENDIWVGLERHPIYNYEPSNTEAPKDSEETSEDREEWKKNQEKYHYTSDDGFTAISSKIIMCIFICLCKFL